MKIVYALLIMMISLTVKAQTYPSLNISLLAHLTPETDNTGFDGRKYSGCWGWYQATKNKEYAIVGTSNNTYFIDVTNPSNPIIRDSVLAKRAGCTWREIKNYQNYCYIVSDDAPPNSFQIVDMQYLPDSVHVVHDGTTYFERCHTIFVDKTNLYCGGVTSVGGPTENLRVYSLATPSVPVLQRTLSQDAPSVTYVHDMFVLNDTVYASCGYQGFRLFKFNGTNPFTILPSFIGYPQNGYNHSSWITKDRKTMVFADEVPAGLAAKVIDVQNISNITLIDTIRSNLGATAHNPYIVGNNYCWLSSYQDGIYLYDISNPLNVTIAGFFDTQPQHGVNDNFTTNAYRGNWGAYPYLPSGIIIACDMQNGIFILQGNAAYQNYVGIKNIDSKTSLFSIYPNPAKDEFKLYMTNQNNQKINLVLTDVLGKQLSKLMIESNEAFYKTTIQTATLPNGCYFITLTGNGISETKKIIIQH